MLVLNRHTFGRTDLKICLHCRANDWKHLGIRISPPRISFLVHIFMPRNYITDEFACLDTYFLIVSV